MPYRKDKLALVLAMLKQFAQLKRKIVDEAGWISLKLSVSRKTAIKMIAAAKAGKV